MYKRKLPEIWNGQGDWETRRRAIVDMLQRELFGYRPEDPDEVWFTQLPPQSADSQFCAGKAEIRLVIAHTRLRGMEFSFPIYASIPKNKRNLPFFVHINFRPDVPDLYMPTEEITDNGFAVFSFGYQDMTSNGMDFSSGLAGVLYGRRERTGGDCGKIPMWSWAASRVMDYCWTLDCLDLDRGAVVGHSLLGKTALYIGMMDERFGFVISNE